MHVSNRAETHLLFPPRKITSYKERREFDHITSYHIRSHIADPILERLGSIVNGFKPIL